MVHTRRANTLIKVMDKVNTDRQLSVLFEGKPGMMSKLVRRTLKRQVLDGGLLKRLSGDETDVRTA